MGEDIEIAMQQAPQPGLQGSSMALMTPQCPKTPMM
jgi:hypothetical protein